MRIVIVGGVAAGASAATRARRCNEDAEIILLEKDEHVSFANCGLPYHIGGEIAERSKLLVATRELLQRRFALDVRPFHEVVSINRNVRTVTVRSTKNGTDFELQYDKLVLCPGASPLIPDLPGAGAAGVFTLRNIADMDGICAAAAGSVTKKAIVIGAGFIGLEMVEQLERLGFHVSLAELQSQVLPPMDSEMTVPLEDELSDHSVTLCKGDGIRAVRTNDLGQAVGVELSSGRKLDGDLIILGLGVRPNVRLAVDAGLAVGRTGGICTNRFLQTSDPDIYAAGDAVEYDFGPTGDKMRVPLAGPANRAGRLAGQHAATGASFPVSPVFGTAIVRVFGLTAGMTGLSAKAARKSGIDFRSVTVVAGHHAGYFPGASPLTLKLLYAPATGKILGAQCIGKLGIDKRIDVIATAMAFGGTVRDLSGLDLSYAPPFGSAKDPLHQAAFIACNELDGLGRSLDADSDLFGYQVVDVRTPAEIQKTPLTQCPRAISIPVDELRDRLSELDPALPTVVSCGVGIRGHVAERILSQHGFAAVFNLSGGATMRRRAVRE